MKTFLRNSRDTFQRIKKSIKILIGIPVEGQSSKSTKKEQIKNEEIEPMLSIRQIRENRKNIVCTVPVHLLTTSSQRYLQLLFVIEIAPVKLHLEFEDGRVETIDVLANETPKSVQSKIDAITAIL